MIRLAIRVTREQAELVLAELLELVPDGVEEREADPDTIEYAVYGAPGELPALPDLEAMAGGALLAVSTSELPDDWSERWKRFHRPVQVDSPVAGVPALRVRPPWEAPAAGPQASTREIVIDPGQAFGTGAHATTKMCLELLLELCAAGRERGAVLDVGTGSGVLAIAAATLGFGPLLGLDHESESVAAAAENAAVNDAELAVRRYDLRSEALPWLGAGRQERPPGPLLVTANLLRGLLLLLAEAIEHPPQELIVSGLLRAEADEVAGVFSERHGLSERARRESGDWAAVWLSAG